MSGIYANYHAQIMLLFVGTTVVQGHLFISVEMFRFVGEAVFD